MICGDIQQTIGTLQLCASQAAGIEIHAMRHIYEDETLKHFCWWMLRMCSTYATSLYYALPCYVNHTPEYLCGDIRSLCQWRDLGLE